MTAMRLLMTLSQMVPGYLMWQYRCMPKIFVIFSHDDVMIRKRSVHYWPFVGESTDHGWMPLQRANNAERWYVVFLAWATVKPTIELPMIWNGYSMVPMFRNYKNLISRKTWKYRSIGCWKTGVYKIIPPSVADHLTNNYISSRMMPFKTSFLVIFITLCRLHWIMEPKPVSRQRSTELIDIKSKA